MNKLFLALAAALPRLAQPALAALPTADSIARHARATHVTVAVQNLPDRVLLTIQDDGRGFDVGQMGAKLSNAGGFGLFNIAERLSQLGGTLDRCTTSW